MTTLTCRFIVLIAAGCLFASCQVGCSRQTTNSPTDVVKSDPVELTVLVVDDELLAAAIERQWNARAEGKLTVLAGSIPPRDASEPIAADVVIYPSGMIGELVERKLIVPPSRSTLNGDALNRSDILRLPWEEATWGRTVYGIPLGSPQLLLLYRPDLFEQLGLEPPASWGDFREVSAALASARAEPGEAEWHGSLEPLADGWAGQVLLARVAGYARYRSESSTLFDYRTMEPLIAGPAFVRALNELAETNAKSTPRLDPAAVQQRFFAGECGMAVTWLSRANAADNDKSVACRIAELPGSGEFFERRHNRWEPRVESDENFVPLLAVAGRLGSVLRSSQASRAANDFLVLLASNDWCRQIFPASGSTAVFRESQLGSADSWLPTAAEGAVLESISPLARRTNNRPSWLFSPRIPGRDEYLAALDQAVQSTVDGDATAEDALAAAVETWREITGRYGVDAQQQAYTRSLGLGD